MRTEPIVCAAFNGGDGSKMEAARYIPERLFHDLRIGDAPAQEHGACGRIICRSGREIVQNADTRATCEQRLT
jgi:hypothetical protein